MFRFFALLSVFLGTLYFLAKPLEVVSLVSEKSTKLRPDPAIRTFLNRTNPRFNQSLAVGTKAIVTWKGKERELTLLAWEPGIQAKWSISEPGTDRVWEETVSATEIYLDPETKRQFSGSRIVWTVSQYPGKEILNRVTAMLFAKHQMEIESTESLLLLPDL